MEPIVDFMLNLLNTQGFPPRWYCGHWTAFHGWFYILSDLAIWGAYTSIPIVLLFFISKRKDFPFPRICWLFSAFIYACGTTHLLDAIMFWWPAYRLTGVVEFLTALVSWVTVLALIPIIPKALTLKSPSALENIVEERTQALEQAKRDLEVSNDNYRLLLNGIQDYAIYRLDPQGRILSWNLCAESIQGFTADEIIGKHFYLFYPDGDLQQNKPQQELEIALTHGRFEGEGWRVRKGGGMFWSNNILTPILDEAKTLVGFSQITRDITERLLSEQQLQLYTQELEESHRELELFIATLTHDLKAPVQGEFRVLELLAAGDYGSLTPEQDEILQELLKSNRFLFHMVNNLLSAYRYKAGKVSLNKESIDLNEMMTSMVSGYIATLIKEKNHQLELCLDPTLPLLHVDPIEIQRVLYNLIQNAVSYTPNGGTLILSSKRKEGQCQVSVQDNGPGIEPEVMKTIFTPYSSSAKRFRQVGSGLGLYLSKKIIEAHGGQMGVKSQPQQGSLFFFILPLLNNS